MMLDAESFTAKHRYARITARKARRIADLIRGRSVNEALELLQFAPSARRAFYRRSCKSAVANARHDESRQRQPPVGLRRRADDRPAAATIACASVPARRAARCRSEAHQPPHRHGARGRRAADRRRRRRPPSSEGAKAEAYTTWDKKSTRLGFRLGTIEPWRSRWYAEQEGLRPPPPAGQEDPRARRQGVRLRRHPAHRDRAHHRRGQRDHLHRASRRARRAQGHPRRPAQEGAAEDHRDRRST